MGQGYNDREDEAIAGKDGAESTKSQTMTDRRNESSAMEEKDHGHKYGTDAHMGYREGTHKILKHMGGRGLSKTDKGIEGLGDPNAEGKFI